MLEQKIKSIIREVNDFPKKGISFKDITPILQDPYLCTLMLEEMGERLNGLAIDAIAAIESRGFLFGFLLANKMKLPFIPIRKEGKLPYKTIAKKYELEYGSAIIEMHEDAIQKGQRILIHDDLLATGGTIAAASELVLQAGGEIAGFSFLIILDFLQGRNKIEAFSNKIVTLAAY